MRAHAVEIAAVAVSEGTTQELVAAIGLVEERNANASARVGDCSSRSLGGHHAIDRDRSGGAVDGRNEL